MGDLPPGYRFSPTEEELLCFYLQNKLHNLREDMERVIPVVHMYNMDPWQLPRISGERRIQDSEQWFFFCPRQEKEAHGGRPTRTTPTGYWKATGSPGLVYSSSNRVIGVKKTMAFYQGRAPTGSKTKWKMNEYKAFEEDSTIPQATPKLRSEFSLCRVYLKSGCVRSFDRRPSLAVPNATASRGKATASGSNAGDFAAEKTDSHDSSSSSGMGFPQSVFGEAMDWKMLEEFDWD